ncbi:MAG: bifunctional diguanylate cyclase/phosphodiesterase, partial [Gammaproteobacteria bacterium]|nr:bifunctional diguanylate cyclase/phosphodiesterase [Gammaproteobacteria bacterium]
TVILEDITAPEDATRVALKILAALAEPIPVSGHELSITTSIGIALYPRDAGDAHTLLRHADAAMYLAKGRGRNNWQMFTEAINVAAAERMALESSLRQALEAGELVLEYQPQVELGAGRVVAMEALVRWSSPQRGIVAPSEFIPVAEESGIIVELGAWVLDTACRQLHEWNAAGLGPLRMAVNLSGRQLRDPRLPERVARALERHAIPPGCLELEIAESCVMANARESIEQLTRLKAIGLHVTIDDFGTAYSSLNHLKRLPIDKLKIDRSFIRDLSEDADAAAIAATIIAMGRSLDLTVVAEGVESEEQLAFLRAQGCARIQGHYFCPPLPAPGCTHFLATGPRLALD